MTAPFLEGLTDHFYGAWRGGKAKSGGHPLFDDTDLKSGPDQWGSSHDGSRAITGEAAALMGIPGYYPAEQVIRGSGKGARDNARTMLAGIAESKGAEVPLYHGFSSRETFAVGDTMTLPTLATTPTRDMAEIYASRSLGLDGPPVMFVLPTGTPAYTYTPGERIMAGRFRVTRIADAATEHGAKGVLLREVHLEQTGVFDPETGWRDRG